MKHILKAMTELQDSTITQVISKMDKICTESLSQSHYEDWLEIVNYLVMVRSDLIFVTDSNSECCLNCKGHGKECDEGYAWVYCTIRRELEEKFEGDCGELKGCTRFESKTEYVQCKYAKEFNCHNDPLAKNCKHRIVHRPIPQDYDMEFCNILEVPCTCHDFKIICELLI